MEKSLKTQFDINFKWSGREFGSALDRATLADVSIAANGFQAMECYELIPNSVSPTARLSAYALATWLAANWWRLRWEPERNNLEWQLSHKVSAAGEGYLWPDLCFVSDGVAILVKSKASPSGRPEELVRYLNNFETYIPAPDFERGIDNFIEGVIARVVGMNIGDTHLAGLWSEVLKERRDSELTQQRKLEAMMGFDPDESPSELVDELKHAAGEFGINAVEEMAACSGAEALHDAKLLWDVPRQRSTQITIPNMFEVKTKIRDGVRGSLVPWQQATDAARIARETWSLGNGPVSSKDLSELFSFDHGLIDEKAEFKTVMAAGYRQKESDEFRVFLNSNYQPNRRFALIRLVCDHVTAPAGDMLLPASTTARTYRQKFQRAFAQEFLCPYSELQKQFDVDQSSDDDIAEAAEIYGVSTFLIKTTLVNKGTLDRAYL